MVLCMIGLYEWKCNEFQKSNCREGSTLILCKSYFLADKGFPQLLALSPRLAQACNATRPSPPLASRGREVKRLALEARPTKLSPSSARTTDAWSPPTLLVSQTLARLNQPAGHKGPPSQLLEWSGLHQWHHLATSLQLSNPLLGQLLIFNALRPQD